MVVNNLGTKEGSLPTVVRKVNICDTHISVRGISLSLRLVFFGVIAAETDGDVRKKDETRRRPIQAPSPFGCGVQPS